MRLEYDPDSGAAYIRLREQPVARTEEIAPGVLVDFADDGRPVGFELLDAASILGGPPRGVEFVLLGDPLARGAGARAS
ncbi:MAG: DUF2283 domain-containing protein [Chloroflexi bacterium]|nr:DUF2283 domain-containing protein [Chloroflexota bacterium]